MTRLLNKLRDFWYEALHRQNRVMFVLVCSAAAILILYALARVL